MDVAKWIIYWEEFVSDTYLYGSEVNFLARDDIEFNNSLMPPGTIIKTWYSKTHYQMQRIEPSLPMIDGESAYKITVKVSGEDEVLRGLPAKLLFRINFFDRFGNEAGYLIIQEEETYFRCPLKTYYYTIELINAGTTNFHFHHMVIEEVSKQEYNDNSKSHKRDDKHGTDRRFKKNKKTS